MKKLVKTLVLAAVAMVGLSACAKSGAKADEGSQPAAPAQKTVLVAYFSATGTTKAVAERVAKAADADLFEIVPEQPYTSADLDWRNKQSRSTVEMNDPDSRPAIKNKVQGDIKRYKTIYLGFPVWWYTAPHIIRTFLESYDLTGVTIIPFATSGGSDIDRVPKDLKNEAPMSRWGKGKLLNDATDEDIKQWVEDNKD